MLRKVPGWIMDPDGPLSVDPRHLPVAVPWLLRWIKAGSRAQVDLAADALWSLHSVAFDAYKELLGEQHFSDLIRQTGQIYVWESEDESAGDRIYDTMRRRYDIPLERLPLK
jgi:D-amino-acid dehydrogenase